MDIAFSCPVCGNKLLAPERRAGKRATCPVCRLKVEVPQNGSQPNTEMVASTETDPELVSAPAEISFPCTECNNQLVAPRRRIGKRAKCPICKSKVVVPPSSIIPPPPERKPPPPPPARTNSPFRPFHPSHAYTEESGDSEDWEDDIPAYAAVEFPDDEPRPYAWALIGFGAAALLFVLYYSLWPGKYMGPNPAAQKPMQGSPADFDPTLK
jgi:hypothetical protein